MTEALIIALIAGSTIPIGAFLARIEHFSSKWVERELNHFLTAFGGGALLAAIALVLVPEGTVHLHAVTASIPFLLGGLAFWCIDIRLSKSGSASSQFLAMLLDFLPESIALGASIALGTRAGYLLALLIALQNLPEGFNAYHEMSSSHISNRTIRKLFLLAPFGGPLAAIIGFSYFAHHISALSVIMLFCSGGILYLIFQDIAPQAKLDRHWFPPLGAVFGFLSGLTGSMLIVAPK